MSNSEKRQSEDGRPVDDADPSGRASSGDDSANVPSCGGGTSVSAGQSVARRLTEIIVENEDADLLLQRNGGEDGVLKWIRALDMQVMGACRADERLKPLLKLNVAAGVADDRLIAHLNQHFEPAEVGRLARCLCIPLVSIRVGKINKQGTLLLPTSIRGNLCLTLLLTSDLRLSFNGDDSSTERLATFSTDTETTETEIEAIPADKSGRSFSIKVSDSDEVSYFWCSEKSMLLGSELLRKMKDLLARKPSLSELSGISDFRLNCFANGLRASLARSSSSLSETSANNNSVHVSELHSPQTSSFGCQKNIHSRLQTPHGSKTNLFYPGNLSPRLCSFKEGLQRSLRNTVREKLRRRGESYASSIDTVSLNPLLQKEKLPKVNRATLSLATLNILDIIGKSRELPASSIQDIRSPSSLSPHYCWCPPVGSSLQYAIGKPQQLPVSSPDSLSLPPLSSLLPSAGPSALLTSKPLLNLAEIPTVDFPDLPPEPLVLLSTSQQIPTFTPFICDPIVHIPIIDVCSSGQAYFVSAGPAMSTAIPPLNPKNLVDPLLPNTESMVERGARETLRMLISSSNQQNSQLLDVFPSVSSNDKGSVLVAGSRGLYSGTRDVEVVNSSISTVGLSFLSENGKKHLLGRDGLFNPTKNHPSLSSSGSSYTTNCCDDDDDDVDNDGRD
ncbi:uncharacterized protein LOC127245835 [Andrographis paniculata]|uniref:uncharacterized protein LOC127245835 n=1 Tax=Andrographis paniculata TaxID=175694 RepID=UPI0021E6EFEE|nr:uncharacterized protein LOC127245835 [Andrographis paniculata]